MNLRNLSNEELLEKLENMVISINVGCSDYQEACDNIDDVKDEILARMQK